MTKLHKNLNNTIIKSLNYGVKGVDSQGYKSAQYSVRDKESHLKLVDYLNEIDLTIYSLTIKPRNLIRAVHMQPRSCMLIGLL